MGYIKTCDPVILSPEPGFFEVDAGSRTGDQRLRTGFSTDILVY